MDQLAGAQSLGIVHRAVLADGVIGRVAADAGGGHDRDQGVATAYLQVLFVIGVWFWRGLWRDRRQNLFGRRFKDWRRLDMGFFDRGQSRAGRCIQSRLGRPGGPRNNADGQTQNQNAQDNIQRTMTLATNIGIRFRSHNSGIVVRHSDLP